MMKDGKIGNAKTHIDENGNTWTEDGRFVMDDSTDSLMDRIERRCNGENVPPLDEE